MHAPPHIILYALIFASAFLAMQFVIGAGRQGAQKIKMANARMQVMSRSDSQTGVLMALRKSRGLDHNKVSSRIVKKLGTLVTQSGLPLGAHGIYFAMIGISLALALAALVYFGEPRAGIAGLLAGPVLTFAMLVLLVKRRRVLAGAQLPEALDVIVRSLKAGHPVPVAIDLVAREMADPLGTEFGMTSDEITYGKTLGKAMQGMADRIGHPDFDLFAATIRLQEKTGGNLAEILQTNAHLVRGRQKMRLKIRAATAEGRMSAMILNVAPILLFAVINAVSPDFYGDLSEQPVVRNGLIACAVWMLIGNLVIRKMINFKI